MAPTPPDCVLSSRMATLCVRVRVRVRVGVRVRVRVGVRVRVRTACSHRG